MEAIEITRDNEKITAYRMVEVKGKTEIMGRNREDALRAIARHKGPGYEGTLVAVTAKGWQPVPVSTKERTDELPVSIG